MFPYSLAGYKFIILYYIFIIYIRLKRLQSNFPTHHCVILDIGLEYILGKERDVVVLVQQLDGYCSGGDVGSVRGLASIYCLYNLGVN